MMLMMVMMVMMIVKNNDNRRVLSIEGVSVRIPSIWRLYSKQSRTIGSRRKIDHAETWGLNGDSGSRNVDIYEGGQREDIQLGLEWSLDGYAISGLRQADLQINPHTARDF
jgi:hypothetical protein